MGPMGPLPNGPPSNLSLHGSTSSAANGTKLKASFKSLLALSGFSLLMVNNALQNVNYQLPAILENYIVHCVVKDGDAIMFQS